MFNAAANVGLSLVAEELEEVDRLRRRVDADGDAVAAADAVGGCAGPAFDAREGEPAEIPGDGLLVGALRLHRARRPLALSSMAASLPPWRQPSRLGVPVGRLVARLVRLRVYELLDLRASLGAGVGVPVTALDHLGQGVAATTAEHEVGPQVHRRPLVLCRRSRAARCPRPAASRRQRGTPPTSPAAP